MEREKLRVETLEEFYFPAPVWDDDGSICPAPKEALEKYQELVEIWMKPHPKLSNEIPSVGLFPICSDEKEGYVVYKQIIYKAAVYS